MFYQVNNVRLFVVDEGEQSPVLLFLHFWGGSSRTWEQVTHLLKDRYRCIRFDHRGWGESEKPATGYSIETLASDALTLVSTMGLDNFVLIGHSMGGKVAQAVAAQRPAGLRKLVLIAPSPASSTHVPDEMRQSMMNAYTSLDGINATIDKVFKADDLPMDLRTQVIGDMQKHTASSRLGWPQIGLPEDVSTGLENIDVPTLVIAGENDIVDPPARLESEVVQKIPRARMVVARGVGHLLMVQAPAKIAALIDDFCRL